MLRNRCNSKQESGTIYETCGFCAFKSLCIYYDMILSIQSEILCFVWLLISVENSLMEVLIINHFENTVLSFQKKHMNTNMILI